MGLARLCTLWVGVHRSIFVWVGVYRFVCARLSRWVPQILDPWYESC